MKKSVLEALRVRDSHCWLTGQTENLVPHHRKNRGMGGRKSLDILSNLILVSADYNLQMESDSKVAWKALEYRHKIRQGDSFDEPVFDAHLQMWFVLDNEGRKTYAPDTRSPQF